MRCVELIMPIINDPTETDPLATIVYKRLSDARRPMNKKKDRLHQAMRAFEPMKKKDKGRQTPAITINGRATASSPARSPMRLLGQTALFSGPTRHPFQAVRDYVSHS